MSEFREAIQYKVGVRYSIDQLHARAPLCGVAATITAHTHNTLSPIIAMHALRPSRLTLFNHNNQRIDTVVALFGRGGKNCVPLAGNVIQPTINAQRLCGFSDPFQSL